MGILGEKVSINLDNYLRALRIFYYDESLVSELRDMLEGFGIRGNIDVYDGTPDDGKAMLKYHLKGEGISGLLTLNESGDYTSDISSGFIKDILHDFVNGLFSPDRTTCHIILQSGAFVSCDKDLCGDISGELEILKSHEQCWIVGSKKACNFDEISRDAAKLNEQTSICAAKMRKIETEKLAAEAEEQRRREVEQEKARIEQERAEIESYVQKGQEVLRKAAKLIEIAYEEDIGPGGINPNDLIRIKNKYTHPQPISVVSARAFYESAKAMFQEMLHDDDSGYVLVDTEKDAKKVDCKLDVTSTDRPHCSEGTPYSGEQRNLTCNTDETYHLRTTHGGCHVEEKTYHGKHY